VNASSANLAVGTLMLLLCIATGDSAFADSLWDHNGSVMRLVADGEQRQLLYERPRQILRGAGVQQGTVLFDGYRVGNKYKGTAKRFSKNCPAPLPYEVSGTVVTETKVVLKGRREVYDDNCRPTGRFRTDTLVFKYLQPVSESHLSDRPGDALPSEFVGVWIGADTENNQCKTEDWERHQNDTMINIQDRVIEHWESGCKVVSYKRSKYPAQEFQNIEVSLECGGEGMTWRSREVWQTRKIDQRRALITAEIETTDLRDDFGKEMPADDDVPFVNVYFHCQ
jgi:hypothetical protein